MNSKQKYFYQEKFSLRTYIRPNDQNKPNLALKKGIRSSYNYPEISERKTTHSKKSTHNHIQHQQKHQA